MSDYAHFAEDKPQRYLPAKGQEQTPVATLSGYTTIVKAVDDLDGKAGTLLHPRFHKDAAIAGCAVLQVLEEQTPVKQSRSPKPMTRNPSAAASATGEGESA